MAKETPSRRRHPETQPLTAGSSAPSHKIYHLAPAKERPISSVYPVIDTDLGRDNVENDLTAADQQDL